MMLSTSPQITGQQLYSSSATQQHRLGTLMFDGTGRKFRYVKAGAVALVPGETLQAPVVVANHLTLAPSANHAIGATTLSLTLGATAATANQYLGGYAVTELAAGLGYSYPIVSHPAAALSTACVFRLDPQFPLQVAVTAAASKVSLYPNPYNGVIETPVTTLTGAVVGVAIYPIVAAEYGWIQTGGLAAVFMEGTPAVGASISCPTDTAGQAAINSTTLPIIGHAYTVGIDESMIGVYLTID